MRKTCFLTAAGLLAALTVLPAQAQWYGDDDRYDDRYATTAMTVMATTAMATTTAPSAANRAIDAPRAVRRADTACC